MMTTTPILDRPWCKRLRATIYGISALAIWFEAAYGWFGIQYGAVWLLNDLLVGIVFVVLAFVALHPGTRLLDRGIHIVLTAGAILYLLVGASIPSDRPWMVLDHTLCAPLAMALLTVGWRIIQHE